MILTAPMEVLLHQSTNHGDIFGQGNLRTMKRILVVDYDAITLQLTERFLSNFGYEVEAVCTSKLALDKLNSPNYDLIISEIDMPGLNGFDLIKLMHKCQINVPLVFLTSRDDRTTIEEARHAGIDRVISKKNDYINLPHIIDNLLYQEHKIAV